MRSAVHVINGPNLNLLGEREPHLYGDQTLAELEAMCREAAAEAGWDLAFSQSNHETEVAERLAEARGRAVGVVVNPAAYCYTSVLILEALRSLDCPAIEVHITHIHARTPDWRAHTLTAAGCAGMISGLGLDGYRLAIAHLRRRVNDRIVRTG
jgi:3-dehydroquinate dehydratase-2